MQFWDVLPFKNAQLTPKPASTDKLTLVTAHSRIKKCMHEKLNQQKLLAPSEYRSTDQVVLQVGCPTDFATTELTATISV